MVQRQNCAQSVPIGSVGHMLEHPANMHGFAHVRPLHAREPGDGVHCVEVHNGKDVLGVVMGGLVKLCGNAASPSACVKSIKDKGALINLAEVVAMASVPPL